MRKGMEIERNEYVEENGKRRGMNMRKRMYKEGEE